MRRCAMDSKPSTFVIDSEVLNAILKTDLERRGLVLVEPMNIESARAVVVVRSQRQCPICSAPSGEACHTEDGQHGCTPRVSSTW